MSKIHSVLRQGRLAVGIAAVMVLVAALLSGASSPSPGARPTDTVDAQKLMLVPVSMVTTPVPAANSGCKVARVTSRQNSATGDQLFSITSYTDFCWNRSAKTLKINKVGRTINFLSGSMRFRGSAQDTYRERFLGMPSQVHTRTATFENCSASAGCFVNYNVNQYIRVLSSGSFMYDQRISSSV